MITIKKSEFKKLYTIACSAWKNKFDEKFKSQVFSEEVSFEEKFLEEMRSACDPQQLLVFNKLFGKYLSKEDEKFSVTTYEQVCKKLNRTVLTVSDFFHLPESQRFKSFLHHQIITIEEYFNDGWKPDWNNPNEYKWYPWFKKEAGGFWFYVSFYYFSFGCGLLAVYKNQKISDYIGKTFTKLYSDYMEA